MQLITTLKNCIATQQTSANWSVFCLRAKEYPGLFCAQVIEHFKKAGAAIMVMDLALGDPAEVAAELSISFLGQRKIYWFGDVASLDAAKKKFYLSFLEKYTGPHSIIFCSDQSFEVDSFVELPTTLDQTQFCELFSFFYEREANKLFLESLFSVQVKLPLDVACMVMQYLVVVDPAMAKEEVVHFFKRIITTERSRFTLSQYFFSKEREFFKMWRDIEPDFPPEFWVIFWSEQIWQASLFVTQAKDVGPLAARKGINRLPFSFMQRDWKRYQERELCAAHSFLYAVDYGMKNGYAKDGLELFLFKFVHGDFVRK